MGWGRSWPFFKRGTPLLLLFALLQKVGENHGSLPLSPLKELVVVVIVLVVAVVLVGGTGGRNGRERQHLRGTEHGLVRFGLDLGRLVLDAQEELRQEEDGGTKHLHCQVQVSERLLLVGCTRNKRSQVSQ